MNFLIVLLVIAVILFALPYLTKRRFGLIGLSLAAGWLLSDMWSVELADLIRSAGFSFQAPPLESVAAFVLILLPPLLSLHASPKDHGGLRRLISALVFSVMATSLLLVPLASAFEVNDQAKPLYEFLSSKRALVVTFGLVLAMVDTFFMKNGGAARGKH